MGNCLKNSVENSIENQPLISPDRHNESENSIDSINSVASPSPFPSSSLSLNSSPSPPPYLFMPLPPASPLSCPDEPSLPAAPIQRPIPVSTKNKMSVPVKKKCFLNELIIKVPEIKANYRWEKKKGEVFSPRKQRFNEERYEKHMKNPNVCQLCETLFPDNTYLQNLDEDEEKRYCFNCVKFLSGEKNKEY